MRTVSNFIRSESGAAAAEYALILSLIAVVVVSGLSALGGVINTKLTAVGAAMTPGA